MANVNMSTNTNQNANSNVPATTNGGGLRVTKVQQFYLDELNKSLEAYSIKPDKEQIACVQSALTTMQTACDKQGITIKDVDQTNIMTILNQIVMLRVNMAAIPREGYMIIRNQKNGNNWVKVFEFGIEGDGNDKLLRQYGVGVKRVYPFWVVREGDDFTYPAFKGISVEPPTWTPKGYTGKIVRVVYPVEFDDGSVQFFISEREGVALNLKAHIINNTKMDKNLSDADKSAIREKIEPMTLDQMFADSQLLKIMSPAWRDPHSREAMILRKMRNNCTKPIPKDFKDAYASEAYEDTYEDYDQYRQQQPDPEDVLEAEFATQTMTSPFPAGEALAESQTRSPKTGRNEEISAIDGKSSTNSINITEPAKNNQSIKLPF